LHLLWEMLATNPNPTLFSNSGIVVRLAEKVPASLYASNVAAPHLRRAQ
jgi:hypothetical protein